MLNQTEIDNINEFQRNGRFHPLTCGGNRHDDAHKKYAEENGDCDLGLLVATENGLICPVCGYTQNWVHDFISSGETNSQK